ncbi:MAG TPA: sugar ABC transporter ATP-binding protein [Candidatus Limnocylindria bacterium]|nr:sugar ABC transporter ATP-binding protein [Candidatus Limnocylindria bacterium]
MATLTERGNAEAEKTRPIEAVTTEFSIRREGSGLAVLRAENLVKDYPGTRALDGVSLQFESGKINALLGKNGSGKSTLVKCFAGAIQPTSGSMYLDGERLSFSSPAEANQKGIAIVYQEMSLVQSLTVTENIYLGRMPKKRGGIVDWRRAHKQAAEVLGAMNVRIDPAQVVSRLSMWQCQVVEIIKAMSHNPRVLILDEPTSALAAHEVDNVFQVLRQLRRQDVIVIYISHKLHEIPEIADTVTVLRDGALTGREEMEKLTNADILRMMFGEITHRRRPEDVKPGDEVILSVRGLSRKGKFEDVSFDLRRAEVLGIAGMLGSGRTELLKSIFGADPYDRGTITVLGREAKRRGTPVAMKKLGLGLTPEDRKKEGLILIHSIQDNLCYASIDKARRGWLEDRRRRAQLAERQVRGLGIKASSLKASVNSLSGGNQQKVVVGNWLNTEPAIMLYDEPSRGIDVAAKQQIFEIMWEEARKGVSSIFVSSELEELLETCHRILVMRHGRLVGEVRPEDTDVKGLYAMCMGGEA